jgi:nucleoside-diphosphate-sugar epimerase
MKILVTGANGYIGKSIVQNLKDQYDVIGITRQDVDLSDTNHVLEYFKDKYFDVVIHCAVVGGSRLKKDDPSVFDQNILMYYNLIKCRSSYGKFIHFGSGAEFYAKQTPYGYSKFIINQAILNQPGFYNIRIFAVFDENELDTRFIKANLINYINKKPIVIHNNKSMDFFYMKDLISLVKYYIDNEDLPKQIDCTYEESKHLLYIATYINTLSNYSVDIDIQSPEIHNGYIGQYTKLPIKYIGLDRGIFEVYKKLIKK